MVIAEHRARRARERRERDRKRETAEKGAEILIRVRCLLQPMDESLVALVYVARVEPQFWETKRWEIYIGKERYTE